MLLWMLVLTYPHHAFACAKQELAVECGGTRAVQYQAHPLFTSMVVLLSSHVAENVCICTKSVFGA